jgi:hypothetical protein
MKSGGARNLDYIGQVFSRLSSEKKDYILESARGLLKIQDRGACPYLAEILPARSLEAERHGPYRTAASMEAETT